MHREGLLLQCSALARRAVVEIQRRLRLIGLAQPLLTQVVMTPLEHRPGQTLETRCTLGQAWKLALQQLPLQRQGGRCDDHRALLARTASCRHEVSQRLARSRPCLDHHVRAGIESLADRLRHPNLAFARLPTDGFHHRVQFLRELLASITHRAAAVNSSARACGTRAFMCEPVSM